MEKPFYKIDGKNVKFEPFEITAFEKIEFPVNKETGETFPNCCEAHKSVVTQVKEWFETFPNCCDLHREMAKNKLFKKEDYNGIENKIVKQLYYTEHILKRFINSNDWYKVITDYIEYNWRSFGNPPVGADLYLQFIQNHIQYTKEDFPKNKRKQLIEYIDTYFQPQNNSSTDLNILHSTYQKWLKTFPFEISFFQHLKPHFEERLPILTGKPRTNMFTKETSFRTVSKPELLNTLIELTNSILTQINTYSLYEKGLLTEPDKLKLELAISERKLKLEQGYINNSKDKATQYRKILKEWLKDEKEFIKEIDPLLKNVPPQPIKTENNKTKQVISELFENMDNKGWKYAFRSEQDYNYFIDILTRFFEYKHYKLPENPIQLKPRCKTKLAATLGNIHSELSNVDKLSTDIKYFNIVKCLNPFSELPNNDLYKALTR